MKKEFLTPSMEISVFDQNDTVTTSGITNEEAVTNEVEHNMSSFTYKGSIAKIRLEF